MRLSSGLLAACASGAFAHNFKRFSNTTTSAVEPSTATGTDASASATATSPAGLPGSVGVFTLFGCVGSDAGFPTFELAETNAEMDLEICGSACIGRAYFGVYDTECYCGDEVDSDNTSRVDVGQCDIKCPGALDTFCGGDSRRKRLQARQAVPAGRLLTVYVSDASGPGATVTDSVTETATKETTVTTTYTTAITGAQTTTTATVTAVEICVSGKCYTKGADRPVFIFIEANGGDCDNEWVYIIEECSCHGGHQYIPKFCSGGSCAGEVVFKTQECHDWWNYEVFYVAADCEGKEQVMYKPWENVWGTPNNCKAELVPACGGPQCPAVKVPQVPTPGYTPPVSNGTWTNGTSHGSVPPVPHCSGPQCPSTKVVTLVPQCNGADCPVATAPGSGSQPTGTAPAIVSGAGKQVVGAAAIFAALFAALL